MGNIFPAGDVDEMRKWVKAGFAFDLIKTDCAKVGCLARGDRAEPFALTERIGTAQRCHVQNLAGRQGAGVTRRAFGEQCGEAHFGKEIQAVVAGRTIGSQSDIDTELSHSCHRGDAAGQLQIRSRAMSDAGTGLDQNFKFFIVHVDRVHADEVGRQNAELVEASERSSLVLSNAVVDLLPGFVDVAVNGEVQLFGKGQYSFECPVADGIGGVWGEAKVDQRVA